MNRLIQSHDHKFKNIREVRDIWLLRGVNIKVRWWNAPLTLCNPAIVTNSRRYTQQQKKTNKPFTTKVGQRHMTKMFSTCLSRLNGEMLPSGI